MRIRERGMPEEGVWAEFFDPESALRKLRLAPSCGDVVELPPYHYGIVLERPRTGREEPA